MNVDYSEVGTGLLDIGSRKLYVVIVLSTVVIAILDDHCRSGLPLPPALSQLLGLCRAVEFLIIQVMHTLSISKIISIILVLMEDIFAL